MLYGDDGQPVSCKDLSVAAFVRGYVLVMILGAGYNNQRRNAAALSGFDGRHRLVWLGHLVVTCHLVKSTRAEQVYVV